jgi:hypothetical protein
MPDAPTTLSAKHSAAPHCQLRGRPLIEPDDKESYRHVLYCILCGNDAIKKTAIIKKAAKRLDISQSSLSDILQGRWKPSKEYLIEKNWTNILKNQYRAGWWKLYDKDGRKTCGEVYVEREAKLTTFSHKSRMPVRNTESIERKTNPNIQGETL